MSPEKIFAFWSFVVDFLGPRPSRFQMNDPTTNLEPRTSVSAPWALFFMAGAALSPTALEFAAISPSSGLVTATATHPTPRRRLRLRPSRPPPPFTMSFIAIYDVRRRRSTVVGTGVTHGAAAGAYALGLLDGALDSTEGAGRGNYVRTDDNSPDLVRSDWTDDREVWARFERLRTTSSEALRQYTLGMKWETFTALLEATEPWLELPRSCSKSLLDGFEEVRPEGAGRNPAPCVVCGCVRHVCVLAPSVPVLCWPVAHPAPGFSLHADTCAHLPPPGKPRRPPGADGSRPRQQLHQTRPGLHAAAERPPACVAAPSPLGRERTVERSGRGVL